MASRGFPFLGNISFGLLAAAAPINLARHSVTFPEGISVASHNIGEITRTPGNTMIHGQSNRRGLVPSTLEGNGEAARRHEAPVLGEDSPERDDFS